MQILNQSQTALNLPNFTQCLKKFVFPSSKKGVKTAQVGKEMGKAAETLTEAKVAVVDVGGGGETVRGRVAVQFVRAARLLVLALASRSGDRWAGGGGVL